MASSASATTSSETTSPVSVTVVHVPPTEPGIPALAVQTTLLTGSYMLWVGIAGDTPEEVEAAPLQGALARDWACAMPPVNVCVFSSTLFSC
jgi:proteasome assembly chaperone 4